MAEYAFLHNLQSARRDILSARTQLNDCLTQPESRLLEPKHRRLLQAIRNNLSRQNYSLLGLIEHARFAIHGPDPLPDFITSPGLPDQMPLKSPSPDNGQADPSE